MTKPNPTFGNAADFTGNDALAKQQNQKHCNDSVQLTETISVPLVDEATIIRTYSEADQFSCQKYFEYLELVKQNPKMGYKKAAKLLNISNGRTRWWHTKGAKRAIPTPLKTVEKLKAVRLLPFDENHPEATDIFRTLGMIFGDGCIDRNLNTLSFISAQQQDVECWKSDLVRIFPFAIDKMNMVEGGEWGHSFCMRTFDRSVIRFFVALGASVGNKTTNPIKFPDYIFRVSDKNRLAFLDGFLSSEVSVPRYRGTFSKSSMYFTDFAVGLNKIEKLQDSHIEYLHSIERLLESIGIQVTHNLRKEKNGGWLRKDGHQTHLYRIFIRTTFTQILDFNNRFPLKYAHDKKRRLEERVLFALECRKEKSVPQLIK